jgi:hypothetical protein
VGDIECVNPTFELKTFYAGGVTRSASAPKRQPLHHVIELGARIRMGPALRQPMTPSGRNSSAPCAPIPTVFSKRPSGFATSPSGAIR